MDEEYFPRYQDRNDPNYDSADEQQHAVSLHTKLSVQINIFKEAVSHSWEFSAVQRNSSLDNMANCFGFVHEAGLRR
jgi:hypothetical protein